MASLLGEQLFEKSGQGPSPPKDFFQLIITKNEVIWTSWKISLQLNYRGASPRELRTSHQDFLHSKMLQQQLGTVLGQRILEYTISLCQGKFDYLERLPDDMMLRIMSYLQLKEITILAQVSHRFRKLCNSEKFWEQTVRNRCEVCTSNMEGIARAMGWRKTFFTFFHTSGSKQQK
ncbi:F-box only protein 36a [Echeneis naucrates]|uniref:F-box only protein 36a n=1 Tax=Echeneis naucrates TaxID=173247 RepID=UPI001113C948|nr:F-box only protein 36 [Echeneis naucrates]